MSKLRFLIISIIILGLPILMISLWLLSEGINQFQCSPTSCGLGYILIHELLHPDKDFGYWTTPTAGIYLALVWIELFLFSGFKLVDNLESKGRQDK